MTTIPREEIDALRAQARADLPLRQRFEMEIRFARELGWIQVRDPFTGDWLEIWGKDAPSGWVRAAFAEKQRRMAGRETTFHTPRPDERPRQEVYAF